MAVEVGAGLLVGGIIAAQFAAYFVKHLSLPVLGGLVGSIILITNGRTLLRNFDAESVAAYGVLFAVAAVIVTIAVRKAGGTRPGAPAPRLGSRHPSPRPPTPEAATVRTAAQPCTRDSLSE